jgi:hypothetical protein
VSTEHDVLRARLGRVGVWTFAFDAVPAREVRRAAAEIETLGFQSLWVPEGGASREIFAHLSLLLDATEGDHGVFGHRERDLAAPARDGQRRPHARRRTR